MEPFDPLSYANLGDSISRALDRQPLQKLLSLARFEGVGVYVLYYTGDFHPYRLLSEANRKNPGSVPIYIGRASAENSRTGMNAAQKGFDYVPNGDPTQSHLQIGNKLYNRIDDHRKSIILGDGIDVKDFQFRALSLTPTWVALAEIISIRNHQPIWNSYLTGLGNHNPGSGRSKSVRSMWDTLHPGRAWAAKLTPRVETPETLGIGCHEYLEKQLNSTTSGEGSNLEEALALDMYLPDLRPPEDQSSTD